MINGFKIGCCYEHSNLACATYIRVLKVRHANTLRIKLRIEYRNKLNHNVQYTGKGVCGHIDEVRVLVKDFQHWTVMALKLPA